MEEKLVYRIEILKAVEDRFNIEIKDEEVEYIVTLVDLIDLVYNKKQNGTN